jgi:hypothetical protein
MQRPTQRIQVKSFRSILLLYVNGYYTVCDGRGRWPKPAALADLVSEHLPVFNSASFEGTSEVLIVNYTKESAVDLTKPLACKRVMHAFQWLRTQIDPQGKLYLYL